MLLYLFGIFILATLNINFVEHFMKNPFLGRKHFLRRFYKVLLNFFYVTIFTDLATLDSKMAAIIIAYYVIVFWVQP